jgi:hypothetical protein
MLSTPVQQDTAARLAGVARGTVASWRTRGHAPRRGYSLGDVLSLHVAARLAELSMPVEPAAAIAWQLAEDGIWPDVLELADAGESLFLVVKAGDIEPFEWMVLTPAQTIDALTPGALTVNLAATAREVFRRWDEARAEAAGR